jgi:hypothetical protein
MSSLIAYTGRRGKGKTSLAYHEATQANRGVCVFDTTVGFGIGRIVHNRAELEEAIDGEISPIVWQPVSEVLESDFIEAQFAEFIHTLKNVRNISIVVDESSYLQSPNWIAPALDDEIRCGRRREHDVFFTQHRIQDCNGILLTLVSNFRFFQTKHPRDLEKIEEIAGARVAGLVSGLKDFEFLGYAVESEAAYIHDKPEFWRVSLAPEGAGTPPAERRTDRAYVQ